MYEFDHVTVSMFAYTSDVTKKMQKYVVSTSADKCGMFRHYPTTNILSVKYLTYATQLLNWNLHRSSYFINT